MKNYIKAVNTKKIDKAIEKATGLKLKDKAMPYSGLQSNDPHWKKILAKKKIDGIEEIVFSPSVKKEDSKNGKLFQKEIDKVTANLTKEIKNRKFTYCSKSQFLPCESSYVDKNGENIEEVGGILYVWGK